MTDKEAKNQDTKDKSKANQEIDILWTNAIKDYLSSYQLPFIALKELLVKPLEQLGGNPDSKADLMKVGKLLQTLGWKKLGKRVHQGKRQQVWCRCDISKKFADKRKSLKPKTTASKGKATPISPLISQPCSNVAKNKLRCGEANKDKALSNAIPLNNTTNNQQQCLRACDAKGRLIEIGDYIQPSSDSSPVYEEHWVKLSLMADECPEIANNPVAKVIYINKTTHPKFGQIPFTVIAQWANDEVFFYDLTNYSDETGTNYFRGKGFNKMTFIDGQWVEATE